MSHDVFINVGVGETRVAVLSAGVLQEFYLERTLEAPEDGVRGRAGHSLIGNIVLGRVQRVLPGMQAAFVDVGLSRAGFLGAKEARCLADLPGFADASPPCITACVREGQAVMAQIVKDPIGDKGARLSANVTLPGRLLVLVPNQPGVALSRRIEAEDDRARLLDTVSAMVAGGNGRFVPGAGYIVRTAAVTASREEIEEDASQLAQTWRGVLARQAEARVPATIYHDLDPIERVLRDLVDADTQRIVIDDRAALEAARAYARRAMPDALPRLMGHEGRGLLFDELGIEAEIEALLSPRVGLRSGGWITIETTEALTAVDVNSGSLTATTGLEETSLRTNLDAAAEIGRQIRLRAIGGLVVIDFIHMSDPANIASVLQTLAMSLGADRVPTQIAGMSEFGLVQITRKRVRDPLMKFMTDPAPAPVMGGRILTPETVAQALLRRIEREARAQPGRALTGHAAPEVVAWLTQRWPEVSGRLAARGVPRVTLAAREGWPRPRIDVGAT